MDNSESNSQNSSDLVKKVAVGILGAGALLTLVYFGFFSDYLAVSVQQWQKYDANMIDLKTKLAAIGSEIQLAQGTTDCKNDQGCRVIGLGAKVCGEFNDFLIYSTSVND